MARARVVVVMFVLPQHAVSNTPATLLQNDTGILTPSENVTIGDNVTNSDNITILPDDTRVSGPVLVVCVCASASVRLGARSKRQRLPGTVPAVCVSMHTPSYGMRTDEVSRFRADCSQWKTSPPTTRMTHSWCVMSLGCRPVVAALPPTLHAPAAAQGGDMRLTGPLL